MQESLAFPQEQKPLEEIKAQARECTRCPLHEGRQNVVFGDGNPDADLLVTGEGPGASEDQDGKPFTGKSGQLLMEILGELGTRREDIYLCNLVLCRTPGNRTPRKSEQARCRHSLHAHIKAVKPKVIVALGRPAAAALLGKDTTLGEIRGMWFSHQGTPWTTAFHPAFVLREKTRSNMDALRSDLRAALEKTGTR